MPIYAYRCEACGHAQDHLQKISDPLMVDCPACGQAAYKKQLTAAGFQLKGSGWYVTDFRDGGKKDAAKKDGDSAAGDSKSDAKADAKASTDGSAKSDSNASSKSDSSASTSAPAPAPAASPAPAPAAA
jgi:putative FmdB family regulatory protein